MQRPLFALSLIAFLASLLGSAAVIHQRGVQTFGAVSGLPDPTLDPRPPLLAINVELEQYDSSGLNRALDNLSAFYWLRQKFDIAQLDDLTEFNQWNTWTEAASAHNQHFVAVLMGGQPNSPSEFAGYASEFATRYQDQIDIYQIWDEPNITLGWGGQPPSATAYAVLLQAAYAAIHAADPAATVIAAALAPTSESGPDNISELIYLQQLYDLDADVYFDAAAGKPYGFYTGPEDRQTDPALLNFSRLALLRQVMERNGDGHKLLWASHVGWNTRADSAWGRATPEQQVDYTLAAYHRAATEWPWAGPLALENYQPNAPADDPRWGFALTDPNGQLTPLAQSLSTFHFPLSIALPGNHLARHPAAVYDGAWEFSELGADIPQDYQNARITITFQGSDLALRVRRSERSDFHAYLYVTVDGQPAHQLPADSRGTYIVLTSPELKSEVVTLPVASGLDPNTIHTAIIQPELGWDQWAFVGFSVGQRLPDNGYSVTLGMLMGVFFMSALGVWHFGRQLNWGAVGARWRARWARLGVTGQLTLAALLSGVLTLTAWLTFGDDLVVVTRRFGDALPLALTALTAGLLYFSPPLLIGLLALFLLVIIFYLRLDLGLAFIALVIPFYLHPPLLWQKGFSLVEIATLFTFAAWCLRNTRPVLLQIKNRAPRITNYQLPITSLDWAVLAFLIVASLSLFTADYKIVALREYRVVILESTLFYFLLRATPLEDKALWRIVDFFVLGAVAVAAIGLYQYFTGANLITAEGGVMRLRSVYGSPNNVALYLGRVLPIAVAVFLIDQKPGFSKKPGFLARRVLYGFAALILGLTIALTFSKGALLLGVPAALAVMVIGKWGQRGAALVGAVGVAGLAAWPLLSRIPRFADILNLTGGTGFFRIKLWESAWKMFVDHPLLGVGLDNFLYHYRGRYILPEAWQDPNLSHPHNLALDYLSRLGMLGFAGGLWLQIAFWRVAMDTYQRLAPQPEQRALALGLMAAMADMLAHGLVDHSFFLVDLAFAFSLILALMQTLNTQSHLHRVQ